MIPFFLIERDGPVVTVTLNRPEERTAIWATMHCDEIASAVAANAGHATLMAKRLPHEGQEMKPGPLLELSTAYQTLAHHTADHHEAVAAFVNKRVPALKD